MPATSQNAKAPIRLGSGPLFGSGGRARTYVISIDFQPVAEPVSRIVSQAPPWPELSEPDQRLLARVVETWPRLGNPLKLAILAIVDAAPGQGGAR